MKEILLTAILVLILGSLSAQNRLRGVVADHEDNEPLIGALVYLDHTDHKAISGLDGSYSIANIPAGSYVIKVQYTGYQDLEQAIEISTNQNLNFNIKSDDRLLNAVVVSASKDISNDYNARKSEQNADNVLNVISSKSIALSPDLTIANVIRRISGVTLERNESGDGQYAIMRGMDKRYNYTLVNGVKIPSPNNGNRYVPLDIFPSDLVDRVEVTKALTPDMEGDALGGVLDMKMKKAPNSFYLNADFGMGYSEFYANNDFMSFDYRAIDEQSYHQRYGEEAPTALISDFTTKNLDFKNVKATPNMRGAFSVGNRTLNDKLGWVLAGSYQNNNRGAERIEYQTGVSKEFKNDGENLPTISSIQSRHYSTAQTRGGVHSNIDYQINSNHQLSLYNMYVSLMSAQVRRITDTTLLANDGGRPDIDYDTRSELTKQKIYNSTLNGKHQFFNKKLELDWSKVYSIASQNRPDLAYYYLTSNWDSKAQDGSDSLRWTFDLRQPRRWEYNRDEDISVYANVTWHSLISGLEVDWKAGAMFRNKDRENIYNEFTFGSAQTETQYFDPYTSQHTDINWTVANGNGTLNRAENYEAHERIRGYYAQTKFNVFNTQILGGLRIETTDQGYVTRTNSQNKLIDFQPTDSAGNQSYTDYLPSIHFKNSPTKNINIRWSYFKGISRPGFYEIIPYRITDENYDEIGNPALKRTTAHNYDLRFEYFPKPLDQVLVGLFYKKIHNPIEFAVIEDPDGTGLAQQPGNYGTAENFGLEFDFTKYIRRFGFKVNYTFTQSKITTSKIVYTESLTVDQLDQLNELEIASGKGIGDQAVLNYDQTRPLQGQSKHVGNISLLFNDTNTGFDAQLALVYTGERINSVSAFRNGDYWQKPTTQLDFSVEKQLGEYFKIYCKINNILNTPYELYIKQPLTDNAARTDYQLQTDASNEVLVRRDQYYRSFLIGLKLKIN